MDKVEPMVGTSSLRDLMLDQQQQLTRPQPQPSPPQRQRPEYSRIPTSTKEHYNTGEKKTESFTSKSQSQLSQYIIDSGVFFIILRILKIQNVSKYSNLIR